jgi:hypothetical protein
MNWMATLETVATIVRIPNTVVFIVIYRVRLLWEMVALPCIRFHPFR